MRLSPKIIRLILTVALTLIPYWLAPGWFVRLGVILSDAFNKFLTPKDFFGLVCLAFGIIFAQIVYLVLVIRARRKVIHDDDQPAP